MQIGQDELYALTSGREVSFNPCRNCEKNRNGAACDDAMDCKTFRSFLVRQRKTKRRLEQASARNPSGLCAMCPVSFACPVSFEEAVTFCPVRTASIRRLNQPARLIAEIQDRRRHGR